jgi:hypothetical protein
MPICVSWFPFAGARSAHATPLEMLSSRRASAAFLPQIPALLETYYAFRDLIGLAWYRLRHGH